MTRTWQNVGACCLCASVLGSVHAFSVLILSLETTLEATRSSVSLSYSLALLSITLAVFLGPRIYARAKPAQILSFACAIAAFGLFVAGFFQGLLSLWIGYGFLFGLGNGLGYGFALQLAGSAIKGREGIGMGLVTAAYGLGGALFALPLSFISEGAGPHIAFISLAFLLLGISGVLPALLRRTAAFEPAQSRSTSVLPITLWVAYFGIVLAGLMVIGHASRIAGTSPWIAPVLFAVTNTIAATLGGLLADRFPARILMLGTALITCFSLLVLAASQTGTAAIVLIALVGVAYGATISIVPAVIAKKHGAEGPAVYGRVFTAWGFAGLLGPWLAGFLFDLNGAYSLALLLAAGFAAISAIASLRI